MCSVAQSCPTLCCPVDCSPPGSSVCPWNVSGKNTGVGCHFLLQGIFLTQGLNLHLSHLPPLPGRFFTTGTPWEAPGHIVFNSYFQSSQGLGMESSFSGCLLGEQLDKLPACHERNRVMHFHFSSKPLELANIFPEH